MYMICFLYTGTLPILEHINENLADINFNRFLDFVIKFRRSKKEKNYKKVCELLPKGLQTAYKYIMSLKHDDKPNYQLIKLWMSTDEEQEKEIFEPKVFNNKISSLFN